MTDIRFSQSYKESVNSIVLPENFKDNILSNLNFEEKIIPIDFEVQRKTKAKFMPRAIISVAAAVILVACVALLFSVFRNPAPSVTKDFTFSISSATNLSKVSGAKVNFKNSKGEYLTDEKGNLLTVYTDESGKLTAELPQDETLKIEVSAKGFIPFEGIASENIYICPEMTENTYRAVLLWTQDCDLDAFLTLTTDSGVEKLHYFSSDITDKNGEVIAALDTDSEVPGAPETITFNPTEDGVWRFSVGSYSSLKESKSTPLANSGATVTLYKGNSLVGEYKINTLSNGNVWSVFEIENGELQICDKTYSVDYMTDIE